MSKIRIKNFGPIRKGLKENDGWINISKTTVFIGNQGSGKSTIAKLISSLSWIEKALFRGDYKKEWFEKEGRLKDYFLKYHRLENYFEEGLFNETSIEYKGKAFDIIYNRGVLKIAKVLNATYCLPQIMYVPAERNFIAYVKTPKELKLSSDSLKEFLTEFDKSKKEISEPISIPINNVNLEYDDFNEVINVKGENYKVELTEASSGFQSLVPLYLVSKYLSESVRNKIENKESMSIDESNRFKTAVEDIYSNNDLTDEQRRIAISALSSKFNKTAFINIVEEPEQNLFPTSQWDLLKKLIEFNNMSENNKLIMTTHSPYIINYLTLAVQANSLKKKIKDNSLLEKLDNIVPLKSTIEASELSIYELNEKDGSIKMLKKYQGIPSDNNFLNNSLEKGNDLFDKLLEIEQEL